MNIRIIVALFLIAFVGSSFAQDAGGENLEDIFGDSVGSEPAVEEEFTTESQFQGMEAGTAKEAQESQQEAEGQAKIYISPDQQLFKESKINFKGERASLINWEDVDEDKYLNFNQWKVDLKVKETEPLWRRNLQERRLRERMGYVLECVGICKNYRGVGFAKVDYLSTIREGDELQTGEDSYLWVFLFDGTLLRISPNSTITMKELNIGREENFVFIRVNAGNVLSWSRSGKEFVPQNFKETDPLFLPLSFLQANPETQNLKVKENDLFAYLEQSTNYLGKYERLNNLIKKNKEKKKPTLYFFVMPNGTVFGRDLVAEFIVLTGNKSYFKLRNEEQVGLKEKAEKEETATFYFRGFNNTAEESLSEGKWYQIGAKGRVLQEYDDPRSFAIGEFVTKNIPTILVARELFYQKYSTFTQDKMDDQKLAENHGYRQWEPFSMEEGDMKLRLKFLIEYTRRAETTNLLAAEQFKKRLERRGEKWASSIYTREFYERAMGKFYNYRDGVSILSGTGETLNSEKKPYWKIIHGLK